VFLFTAINRDGEIIKRTVDSLVRFICKKESPLRVTEGFLVVFQLKHYFRIGNKVCSSWPYLQQIH
jgi:hypothetical protein